MTCVGDPDPRALVLVKGVLSVDTVEVVDGKAFVDYDEYGRLIQVEVIDFLSPLEVMELVKKLLFSQRTRR